jgi:hypothetical protein
MSAPALLQTAETTLLRVLRDAPDAPTFLWLRPRFARAIGLAIPKEPVANLWTLYALGGLLHRTLATLEAAGLVASVKIKRRELWMLTERGRRAVEEEG